MKKKYSKIQHKKRYVEGYLEYFKWSLKSKSTSVEGGLKQSD